MIPPNAGTAGIRMRRMLLIVAAASLAGCFLGTEDPSPPRLSPGAYRGNHGQLTRLHDLESELVLDPDGTFRYFQIDSNTAYFTAKGKWKAQGNSMEWSGVSRSYLYHGGFGLWDTLASPDTSYLRNITDSGFERLETTYDTQFVSVVRWIPYRLFEAEADLPAGKFEYRETYRNGVDSTLTDTALTRLEITRDGRFLQDTFLNGVLTMTDVDSQWTQRGHYLITSHNRHCEYQYDPEYIACGDSSPGFEFIARIGEVDEDGFRLWISPDHTRLESPYWVEPVKIP